MSYIGNLPRTQKGGRVAIATVEANGDSSIDFIDGTDGVVMDSTYTHYEWRFVNIHAATNSTFFGFQFNAAGGSGFNETLMTSHFKAEHNEAGAGAALNYTGSHDLAQATTFQKLGYDVENAADDNLSGVLTLYNPSSTTYSKNFIATVNYNHHSSKYTQNVYITGYVNTTSAIDEIQFKMDSGNIDDGVITMYGIKNDVS